jgi:hypothetical protein
MDDVKVDIQLYDLLDVMLDDVIIRIDYVEWWLEGKSLFSVLIGAI